MHVCIRTRILVFMLERRRKTKKSNENNGTRTRDQLFRDNNCRRLFAYVIRDSLAFYSLRADDHSFDYRFTSFQLNRFPVHSVVGDDGNDNGLRQSIRPRVAMSGDGGSTAVGSDKSSLDLQRLQRKIGKTLITFPDRTRYIFMLDSPRPSIMGCNQYFSSVHRKLLPRPVDVYNYFTLQKHFLAKAFFLHHNNFQTKQVHYS